MTPEKEIELLDGLVVLFYGIALIGIIVWSVT